MAFENLGDKLTGIFKNLRGKVRITEKDVKDAMREVKLALLEADVNFKVVKQFVKKVEERAIGTDVLESLTPGQQVIKIVNEELVSLMGGEGERLVLKPSMVIMMVGLQGAGKTTTAAKLAGKFKSQGRRPLLVACDVYRPAAIDQLKKNGEKVGIPVFSMGTDVKPTEIVRAAMQEAKDNSYNVVIIDTAGRLHIDDDMMAELAEIKKVQNVDATLLTVDAMTGQDAVNVASEFSDKVGIDGVILTKLDGDARGGAALSIKAVTDKPIYYAGMGEKLTDLEEFHPDRMAGRILGMGDMLTLIEKAQETFDEEQARKTAAKLKKSEFDFNDYLDAMAQMNKMGGLSSVLSMMPGLGGKSMPEIDESQLTKISSMIYSMTPEERANPKLLNPSRRNRIARGCGQDIATVNRVVKQFEQMKKVQKQLNGMMKNKHGNRNLLGGLKQWL